MNKNIKTISILVLVLMLAVGFANADDVNVTNENNTVEYVATPVVTPEIMETSTSVQVIATPTETARQGLNNFDNIQVDHTIKLCDITSDNERATTGGALTKNCGKTTFTLNDHPSNLQPSGGTSGKISASEMVYVDVITSGSMSAIPWRTQTVIMNWYDGSDNRLMYTSTQEANNIDNHAGSFVGNFPWEINKPGKYYVDVTVVNWGTERLVFDVVDGDAVQPVVPDAPIQPVEPVAVVSPNHVAEPVTPAVIVTPGTGCWTSGGRLAYCAGADVRTGLSNFVKGFLNWH